jgi:hypothetical protein
MAINTASGTIYSAPRIIDVRDSRGGCPGSAADGSILITTTFTVDNPAVYWFHGRIIYNPGARGGVRADAYSLINGSFMGKYALNSSYANSSTVGDWEELNLSIMGSVAAGTHTITLNGSNGANCWGCGGAWGQNVLMVWEAA